MVDPPSGRMPAKAPRWDLMDTEGYSGGNCVSSCSWMFSGYVGIYRRKKYVGGHLWVPGDRGRSQEGWARPPISWPPRLLLDLHSKFSGSRSFQKSRSRCQTRWISGRGSRTVRLPVKYMHRIRTLAEVPGAT